MGPLGELGALFNPGMRHEEEEKLAKEMLREEAGTGRKGRRRIDLDSGVVVIGNDEDDADQDDADQDDADQDDADQDDADQDDADDDASTEASGVSTDDSAESANGASTGTRGDTEAKPAPKPGEPQIAKPPSSSVPSGKARRRAEGKMRRAQ